MPQAHDPENGIICRNKTNLEIGKRVDFDRSRGQEVRREVPSLREVESLALKSVRHRVQQAFNPQRHSQWTQPISFANCTVALHTHCPLGVTHMHLDRGDALNIMVYGVRAWWLCVDARTLSVGQLTACVQAEHGTSVLDILPPDTDMACAEEVVRTNLQALVGRLCDVVPAAVYLVEQVPGDQVHIPSGVCHAVYTLSLHGGGACKVAMDFPPQNAWADAYEDQRKARNASQELSLAGATLAGWSKRPDDCVVMDAWLLGASHSLSKN